MHVYKVFDRIRNFEFYQKLKRCGFGKDNVNYLGSRIARGTLSMDLSKSEAVVTWPTPTCIKEI